MPLYKRKDSPYWWQRWPAELGGAAESTKCKSKRAAQAWCRKREVDLLTPGSSLTLSAAFEALIEGKRAAGRAAGTIHFDECKAVAVLATIGDIPLREVTPAVVESFARARLELGHTQHNTYREVGKLQEAMRKAARLQWWTGDATTLKPEWLQRSYVPRRTRWTEDEARRVVFALPPGKGARVAFALATSASWAPTGRVKPADYDRTLGRIWVHGSKTRRRARWVPVLPWVQDLADYAFAHLPYAHWENSNSHRDLGVACRRLGVPKCGWNDMRGSYGWWARKRGLSSDLVATFLGHANDQLVQEVYAELGAADKLEAVEAQLRRMHPESRAPTCTHLLRCASGDGWELRKAV